MSYSKKINSCLKYNLDVFHSIPAKWYDGLKVERIESITEYTDKLERRINHEIKAGSGNYAIPEALEGMNKAVIKSNSYHLNQSTQRGR